MELKTFDDEIELKDPRLETKDCGREVISGPDE
jgi:hypothetical protein